MKTCDTLHERLWPYLDGALDPADADLLTRHIESCPECGWTVARARAFLGLVRRAGRERAPAALVDRVAGILEGGSVVGATRSDEAPADGEASPDGTDLPHGHDARGVVAIDRRRRWWTAGAVLAAAALAAVLLLQPGSTPGTDSFAAAHFMVDHAGHALSRPAAHPFPPGARIPEPPRLRDARIAGLSRCVVSGRVYAHYTLRVRGNGVVSAFVPLDASRMPAAGATVESDGSVAVVVGERDRRARAVLVSHDLTSEDLGRLWAGA